MSYRVEQLAHAADVAVDTIRYYQRKGLIAPPERKGRTAVYSEDHHRRLMTIRQLSASGFTLAQIKQLLENNDDALLRNLMAGTIGQALLTKGELASEAGVDGTIIDVAVSIGLLSPSVDGEEQLFPASALAMLQAAGTILASGIPLDKLAELATEHAGGIAKTVETAIDLFSEHVRPHHHGDDLSELFKSLMAQTTLLVAEHFYRTLTSTGIERLRDQSDPELVRVLAEAEGTQLTISSEWA